MLFSLHYGGGTAGSATILISCMDCGGFFKIVAIWLLMEFWLEQVAREHVRRIEVLGSFF